MKKSLLLIAIITQSILGFSQCVPNITNNLLGYWCFSGNANDCSGNGYHGVVTPNVSLTTDPCMNANQAYSFGGSGKYITVANNSVFNLQNTDFTISAWAYLTVQFGSTNSIVAKRFGSGPTDGYMFHINANHNVIFSLAGDGSGSLDATSTTTLTSNTWNHVVASYNLGTQTLSIYINGVLNSQTAAFPSPASTNMDLIIANDFGFQLNSQFNGKLDEIRIYTRELDSCDIDSLYHQLCGVTSVKENPFSDDIKLFPNPSKGKIQFEINSPEIIQSDFTITNLIGEQTLKGKLLHGKNELNFTQPAGIYFLNIFGLNHTYSTKIIVE